MKIHYFLLSLCISLVPSLMHAEKFVNTEDHLSGIVRIEDRIGSRTLIAADKQSIKEEKQQYRAEKRLAWFSKVINNKLAKSKDKTIGGFDDPVDKWFWYWIIAWGGAIVFSFLFWPFTLLLSIAGTICLILWIVKKFG